MDKIKSFGTPIAIADIQFQYHAMANNGMWCLCYEGQYEKSILSDGFWRYPGRLFQAIKSLPIGCGPSITVMFIWRKPTNLWKVAQYHLFGQSLSHRYFKRKGVYRPSLIPIFYPYTEQNNWQLPKYVNPFRKSQKENHWKWMIQVQKFFMASVKRFRFFIQQ